MRLTNVMLAGLVVLSLAACNDDTKSAAKQTTPTAGVAVIATSAATDAGFDALISGELNDEGGCVHLVLNDGSMVLPIFPDGLASWDDGNLTIEAMEGPPFTYQVGDEVTWAGATIERKRALKAAPQRAVPEACERYDTWGMVSPFQP